MPEADEAATAISGKLDKVLGLIKKWPGADAQPDTPQGEVPTEAKEASTRARKKYDATLRWILAVFSAIGVLIFGSLPFTDLGNVDPWLAFTGLGLAASGLGVIIWAAATALEPEDASLGELAYTLSRDAVGGTWRSRLFPREAANAQLKSILQGPEATAHLGPGVSGVEQLITRLGQVEASSMRAYIDWDGGDPVVPGPAAPAAPPAAVPAINAVQNSVAARTELAEKVKKELELLAGALEELRKQRPETGPVPQPLAAKIEEAQQRYLTTLGLLPWPGYLRAAATSKAWDELRDFYRGHRELILDESLVAQMRGTFAVVLRQLLSGAALVALGGLTYAWAVANPTGEGSLKNPVSVTVEVTSDAGKEVVESKCLEVPEDAESVRLEALLITSRDADGLQDGPFSFAPLTGKCAGHTFDVKQGEGRYAGASDALATEASASSSPEPAEADNSRWVAVAVTVLPNTAAYRSLNDCRASDEDVSGVHALLIDSSDPDAGQDGPFSARIVDGACAGRLVTVADGDGSYRLRP